MSQDNESQVSRVARMPKPDNYEALLEAFQSLKPLADQWPGVEARQERRPSLPEPSGPPPRKPAPDGWGQGLNARGLPTVACSGKYL